jgi:ribonuclease R
MSLNLSTQDILEVFHKHPGKTFRLRELVVELGLRSSQARQLRSQLKELERERQIEYLKKNHFALVRGHQRKDGDPPAAESAARSTGRAANTVSGRLIGHRDGFGFVVPDQPLQTGAMDIYISPDGMGSAMHGDRVDVQIVRARGDGRVEGRILRVTDRAQKTVVGEFRCGERHNYVVPYDHRIPFEIVIPRGQEWPAGREAGGVSRDRQFGGESEGKRPGRAEGGLQRDARELDHRIVDVEITAFPRPATAPRGRVMEILGRREEFGVDVEIIIRKFHLPHRFPAEVLAEAGAAPEYIPEAARQGRRDFRHLPIVTIDGETAKDFDDAVYVERTARDSYLLQVHIADVAHYVRPGTALDREARLRGTSVYFPDRAVPMLPLELSNGICSLNPKVDRLVMSALMEIDGEGNILVCELAPGIIRSAERMTYTAVRDVLAGEAAARERYAPLVGNFLLMEELARILMQHRERRGSIDFDLPEPVIEFDEHGRMTGVTRSERNIAHRLIEEFMLAANESVASYLERAGVPSLYRIHEKPDPRKVIQFEEIAATFGYSLGVELPPARRVRVSGRDDRDRYARAVEQIHADDLKITPRHYQRLTLRLEGKPEERILSYLMLRSLKQARYAEENQGHFALATGSYTHFTSPIRRYPDLVVHRILKAQLAREGGSAHREMTAGLGEASKTLARAPDQAARPKRGTQATAKPEWKTPPAAPALGASLAAHYPAAAFVPGQELTALALETSESERRAADAERELMEWKKVTFMADKLGEEFEALIISLTKHGFFVELTDLFVEGFVPLASLGDDYYVYQESQRAIIGRRAKRAFHLGERVQVRLDRTDRTGMKLEFAVVSDGDDRASQGGPWRG